MITEAKEINRLINTLWKFIKEHDIPPQNDIEAWDKIMDDVETLLKADYIGNTPKNRLFRSWVKAYMDYMSDISKGEPTLMQEAEKVVKSVI